MKRSIVELMNVPVGGRDLEWLVNSLESAAELEFATLPPYLCAMWSIKRPGSEVGALIRDIVFEEMLHMGLVCNMLTAIGGVPRFNEPGSFPTYPGHLPGGVRPALVVYLAGLTKDYLQDVCMQIEYPENGPVALSLVGETYPTIGAFYDAILAAFQELNPHLNPAPQLTAQIGAGTYHHLYPVLSLTDVERAIQQIKEQGEGTSDSPEAADFGNELAHFYKFAEIYHGKRLIRSGSGQWVYEGAEIPFPETYPIPPIPANGYPNPAPEVGRTLSDFNLTFTDMVDNLRGAWDGGGETALDNAIYAMSSLKGLAKNIMAFALPDATGVYGPEFRLAHAS